MSFLKYRSFINSSKPKTVVISVNIPQDKSLLSPRPPHDLYNNSDSVSKGEKSKYNLNNFFSFLQEKQKDDNYTNSTSEINTESESSDQSISTKDTESSNGEPEFAFPIMKQSGSADSVSSSASSYQGFDDRDDFQSLDFDNFHINMFEGRDENLNDEQKISSSFDQTPSTKSEPCRRAQNDSEPVTVSIPKIRSCKEIRRMAADDTKNYIHVFLKQLTTVEEDQSEEGDENNDDIDYVTKPCSFVDENELYQRWNYFLHLTANERVQKEMRQDSHI